MKPPVPRRESPHPARVPDLTERWSAKAFYVTCLGGWFVALALAEWMHWFGLLALPMLAYTILGVSDRVQGHHAIRRNFPVLGRLRYVLEGIRPELRQYFVEDDHEENPVSRSKRSIVYARAKGQLDTVPFGTQRDVYRPGYEWINHSMAAMTARHDEVRIQIGASATCTQPYGASILNISAMSYGSLSANAVLALNGGAKDGAFFHNTGEGGVSPYHLELGGDLCWQVGTGYFGCRGDDGGFAPERFAANAVRPEIKLIEIKLSQGAKPGHGGILPARKVTEEISAIRGVPMGQDVLSPPGHSAFSDPEGLMRFVEQLRELSGGKPVGFKLCIGSRREFLALCKAMHSTGLKPDFITIDGGEGGTGAAPVEFSNSVGSPLVDGLVFAHHALIAAGLREEVKIIASGKIATGFHVVRLLALGADLCNSARAMMFALGCIQALKCNTNHCPVGVATQDRILMQGLVVEDKRNRVGSYHAKTVEAVYELLGAAGVDDPNDLRPWHIRRRGDDGKVLTYEQLYPTPEPGCLLAGEADPELQALWEGASPDTFAVTYHPSRVP
jgi:glutamate synthase domain-containing protein 2